MTTESPTLPEWEAAQHRTGHLPHLHEDEWARDPDYLIARIQDAMTIAADAIAEERTKGDRDSKHIADAVELKLLRIYLERLAKELRPHTRAADEMLDVLIKSHPQIDWSRLGNGFYGHRNYHYEGDATIADCALQLRLPEVDPKHSYCRRRWEGVIEGWDIAVVA